MAQNPAGEKETTSSAAPAGEGSGTREVSFTVPQMPALGEFMEPKRLLWYGGLAAAGVVGILEWPVVAAVGVGTYVAERFARSNAQGRR